MWKRRKIFNLYQLRDKYQQTRENMGLRGIFLLELIVPQVWAIGAVGPPLGRQRPLSGLVPLSLAPVERLVLSSGPQSYGRPPVFFLLVPVLPPGLLRLLFYQLLAYEKLFIKRILLCELLFWLSRQIKALSASTHWLNDEWKKYIFSSFLFS